MTDINPSVKEDTKKKVSHFVKKITSNSFISKELIREPACKCKDKGKILLNSVISASPVIDYGVDKRIFLTRESDKSTNFILYDDNEEKPIQSVSIPWGINEKIFGEEDILKYFFWNGEFYVVKEWAITIKNPVPTENLFKIFKIFPELLEITQKEEIDGNPEMFLQDKKLFLNYSSTKYENHLLIYQNDALVTKLDNYKILCMCNPSIVVLYDNDGYSSDSNNENLISYYCNEDREIICKTSSFLGWSKNQGIENDVKIGGVILRKFVREENAIIDFNEIYCGVCNLKIEAHSYFVENNYCYVHYECYKSS